MNSHVENQTTILDLPNDIMHNFISKYLLEDKQTKKYLMKKMIIIYKCIYSVKLKIFLIL